MALVIIVTMEKPLPDAQAVYVKADSGVAGRMEIEKLDFCRSRKRVAAITSLLSEKHRETG